MRNDSRRRLSPLLALALLTACAGGRDAPWSVTSTPRETPAADATLAPESVVPVTAPAAPTPSYTPSPTMPTAPVATVVPAPAVVPAIPATPVVPAIPTIHLSRFAAGSGPSSGDGVVRLLDAAHTPGQSNAVAYDLAETGARESAVLRCKMRVLPGGDGGAFVFLNTARAGARGPAPFVANWTEPNLPGTFAVGIDVHDPKNEEPFGPWGNYQGLPEREVSLHWDGREIVKRVADAEFRGDFAAVEIALRHVCGGAEVTVRIGAATVYDATFIADLHPYEMRPAIGAGTRADATTEFDVRDVRFEAGPPAAPRRPPVHVEVFHHVRTDNSRTAFEADADLPPVTWAFGRVVLTLDIHDGGNGWDEWDRNGEVSIVAADGRKLGIVPFITSYRTPCHWQVDVTHFRPLLAGKVRFEVEAGTTFYKNRGYLMSVSLDFHHGVPELEPYRVVPLWVGIAHHGSPANHFQDFFTPAEVAIDGSARAARVFTTTTGHSQVGEFTPADRVLTFVPDRGAAAGAGVRFENRLWKTDCYLNPNRPQAGTWKYSRAGWAPGDVVRPWRVDLTPHLRAGATAEFRYEAKPYDFSGGETAPKEDAVRDAIHVVRSYLVLYREPAALVPAPTLRILDVVDGGNAAKAGVRAGDWLDLYEGGRIDSLDQLRAAVQAAQDAGKTRVKVVVLRGAERIELDLPPGKMGVALSSQ